MRALYAVAISLALASCAGKKPVPPQQRAEQQDLAARYAQVENYYRANSKFRTDYNPADAPFDAGTLTRNFMYIAQQSETQTFMNSVLVRGNSIPLSRWSGPVRIWTTGETPEDTSYLGDLLSRVTRLTNLRFIRSAEPQDANLHILIADAEERKTMLNILEHTGRLEDAPLLRAWPELPQYPCVARVFVNPETSSIEWAIIFIKDELSGAFRRSCLTEEFVQSLGLFNDGDDIRPSIFNDDGEFIALTNHDEYLLRMLYDPRLQPGMTSKTVEPIAHQIATELLVGDGI